MLNHEPKFPSKRGFVTYIPLIILLTVETGYIIGGLYIDAVLALVVMSAVFLTLTIR